MEVQTLTKDVDVVLLAKSILMRLGAGKLTSFESRLITQKVQYFAQVFGVSPAYRYSLYLHGPYSPDLTKDLFAVQSLAVSDTPFAAKALEERFSKLRGFITKLTLSKKSRDLELCATLHWLMFVARMSTKDARKKLIELKKATVEEADRTESLIAGLSLS